MTDTLSDDVGALFPIEGAEQDQQPAPDAQPVGVATEPVEQVQQDVPAVEQAPSEAPASHQEQHVPLGVFLDKRDEAKELKRKLAETQAQLQQYQKPQEVKIPDPYGEPEAYNAFMRSQVEDQAFSLRVDMSGQFAEQQHGKEKVEAAVAWAQEQGSVDPTFGMRLRNQQNPVGWVVEQYNRDLFFKQYGSDPSALVQQGAPQANQGQVAPQPVAQAALPKQAPPPRSLVNTPSSSGHQTIPDGSIFSSVKFKLD